jgi:hypothetical protein
MVRFTDHLGLWQQIAGLLLVLGPVIANRVVGAEDSTNLLFHASFETGVRAETARGSREPSTAVNFPSPLPAGRIGKAAPMEAGVRLAYPSKGNVNPGSGSVLVWIKPHWQGRRAGELAPGSRGIFDCGTADRDNSDVYLAYFPHIPGIAATFDALRKQEWHGQSSPWLADNWHHVAMTWDCTAGIHLFCDGTEVMHKIVTWRPKPISPYFSVGSGYRFANSISGLVDELFIYDRPLSHGEVLRIFDGRPVRCPRSRSAHLTTGPSSRSRSTPTISKCRSKYPWLLDQKSSTSSTR